MKIEFEKWHGCRNDFLVTKIDANENYTFDSLKRQAEYLCNRDGSGIGADGIICLHMPAGEYVFPEKLSIINSDGSLAETCGNGIRCAAGSVLDAAEVESKDVPEDLNFGLPSGEVSVRTLGKLPQHKTPVIAVDMGVPTINEINPWHQEAVTAVNELNDKLGVGLNISDVASCEILNQHIVVFCESATLKQLRTIGPAIQSAGKWDGINLHIAFEAELADAEKSQGSAALSGSVQEKYEVLVWERGAGETAACGSGACAVGAAVLEQGMSSREDWIQVQMPGGPLYVKQSSEEDSVTLAGPAKKVFSGSVEI